MSRLWLAALGAAAVIACGDDTSGGEPNEPFPDVAGVYAVEGEFDGVDPSQASFTGSVTIEQESLESSILTGTANITISTTATNIDFTGAELENAAVTLAGVVSFTITDGPASWEFTGERAGDILEGDHTLTVNSESMTGTWTGER
jgi:hypothetical protein